MTKAEAIEAAKIRLSATGSTQEILRRGDMYDTQPSGYRPPRGWKVAEMISKGNVQNY